LLFQEIENISLFGLQLGDLKSKRF